MSLALSRDGVNWDVVLPHLDYQGGSALDYPFMIQSADKLLHVVYSWKKEKINHLVLDPWVLTSEDSTSADLNRDGVVNFLDFAIIAKSIEL